MFDEYTWDKVRGLTVVRDPKVSEVKINPETQEAHCPPEVYDELVKKLPKKRYVMK